jgi:2-dehydro-3-deoxygluconokinase
MTVRNPVEIVTFGEVMGLVLADGLPLPLASRATLATAGAEATVVIGLARLGHDAAFLGRVGDDVFGRRILRELRAEGVDVSALRFDSHRTGLLIRDAVQDRPIIVEYYRAGSAGSHIGPDDIPRSVVANAKVLHITGITAALSESAYRTVIDACAVASGSGTTVVFDPNVRSRLAPRERWIDIVRTLADCADVILAGSDDLAFIGAHHDPEGWFGRRAEQTLVIKNGAAGATEISREGRCSVPGRAVSPVDPVGAGDAFAAGWISAWLRDRGPEQRLREANIVASCSVGYRGDATGLPDANVLQALCATDAPDVAR